MFCCAGYEEGIESVDSQDTSILLLDPECLDAQVFFTLGLLRGPQVGDFYISSKSDLVAGKKEYLK
jgi:hypothetical protein